MFINKQSLLRAAPILDMYEEKMYIHGTSFGLGEAGYDIRIQEHVRFRPGDQFPRITVYNGQMMTTGCRGRFILASSMETFNMPQNLVGTVRDKSTWARRGLSVFNTIIEPGWRGILTLELIFNGSEDLTIPAGAGIAQVLFGTLSDFGDYGDGKYQDAQGIEQAKF